MKRILLIILTFTFLTCQQWLIDNTFAQQYGWMDISNNIPPFPYDTTIINGGQDTIIAGLIDLFFIDDNEGWITTYHPFNDTASILHTTDGGLTFEIQTTILPCHAIWMRNSNEGYAGGQSGFVYRTTDGGASWPFLGTIGATLTDLTFAPGGGTGYACGFNGAISSVTSSGVVPMASGVISDLDALSFPASSSEGWVVGGSIIRHFTGGNWVADQVGPSGSYIGVYFVDSQNGWAVGDNGRIIHTSDGINWATQTNSDPQSRTLFDVFFLNTQEGWAVGSQGIVLHTVTGGTTWIVVADGLTTNTLTGVQFTSSTNGYVVGGGKTFLKYTQLTSVEDEETQPTEFKLEQNYPNPFNPSTKIKFTIPQDVRGERREVSLKVYDVLGKEIATLVNEEKPAGTYEVEFNSLRHSREGGNLTSGVYFYQLRAGNFIETRKMILLK